MSDGRKAFEIWFESDAMPLEHSNWFARDENGDYVIQAVQDDWEVWQAAREGQQELAMMLEKCMDDFQYIIDTGAPLPIYFTCKISIEEIKKVLRRYK